MKDLLCSNCGEDQACSLLFFEKVQKETGKQVWLDPSILCNECVTEHLKQQGFDIRPKVIGFEKMRNPAVIGWLVSKKDKESNAMAFPFWKKKLWRVHNCIKFAPTVERPCHEEG